MPEPIAPEVRRWLVESMLPTEGGYKPTERPDTETLFGTTIAQWKRAIPHWVRENPQAMQALPESIRTRFASIEQAARADDSEALQSRTSSLLKYIGRQLDPIDHDTQRREGIPYRTFHFPPKGASAQTLAEIRAVQEVAFDNYNRRYIVGAGFDRWPEFMQEHGMDFAIHGGPPRARWAAVKALYESGVITDEEYRGFPSVTTDQANGKYTFAKTKPKGWPDNGAPGDGQYYATREASERIIDYFQRIDPYDDPLHLQVWQRFRVWRQTYNERLVENIPSYKQYQEGFNNRIRKLRPPPGSEETGDTVIYTFPVQYRDGMLWSDDRIAVNIDAVGPDGRAASHLLEYRVDRATGAFKGMVGELPPSIELVPPGGRDSRGHVNNNREQPALSWVNDETLRDDATGRMIPSFRSIMITLSPELHYWVRDAAVEPGMLWNSVPTGEFARDPKGQLDPNQSDLMALIAQVNNEKTAMVGRMQVLDISNEVPPEPGITRVRLTQPEGPATISASSREPNIR